MYKGVVFDDTEDWCKIWRKTDLCFQKWHELDKFDKKNWLICIGWSKQIAQLTKFFTHV